MSSAKRRAIPPIQARRHTDAPGAAVPGLWFSNIWYKSARTALPTDGWKTMAVIDDVKTILGDTLQLGDRATAMEASTPLFGSIPEFDSMAVVSVITALEDQFDFVVDDEEITAEVFETVGALSSFVEQKLSP